MEPAVTGLILVSVLAGGGAAWLLARFVRVWAGWALAGGLAVALAGFILAAQSAQGMEGLGHIIMALVFAAPAMLGAVLGAALGGWMRRRTGQGAGERA